MLIVVGKYLLMLALMIHFSSLASAQVKFRPVSAKSVLQQPNAANAATVNSSSVNAGSMAGDQTPSAAINPQLAAMAESLDADKSLKLDDVIASLYRYFPLIQQASLERSRAGGQIVGAYGAYDTKLQGYTLSEPTGFYRNYRNGIGFARQTWWGTYLSAGYRIGRGDFQPWYKERETNKGGEFKLAMGIPLLQGRAIDSQRVAVFQATLAQQAAEPMIQQAILSSSVQAAAAYWEWIAAGAVLKAQRELLQLAETRGEQYEVGVKAGKYAEIDLIFNQQLIAERRAKTFESEQKFRATSFKLSLYLRDEAGQPIVPDDQWLPDYFPDVEPIPTKDFEADLAAALSRRPEPQLLKLEIQQIQYDKQLATNNLMPRIDTVTEASQDAGQPASSSNDKGRFELMVGLQGEVPIQRRYAKGKIQETTAKIAQLNEKLRLQQDKIGIELLTAHNALVISLQVIQQAEISLRTATETMSRYRFGFDRGKVDLIYINLLESKVNETEIKLVDAQRNAFVALAEMQAALGLDPLDQAMLISSLPTSTRPGPGHLPEAPQMKQDQFDRDWKLHEPSKP
ncbi:MAG: TolC family protein [Pirellulales bacterium]